jgi:hypothetical protein
VYAIDERSLHAYSAAVVRQRLWSRQRIDHLVDRDVLSPVARGTTAWRLLPLTVLPTVVNRFAVVWFAVGASVAAAHALCCVPKGTAGRVLVVLQ